MFGVLQAIGGRIHEAGAVVKARERGGEHKGADHNFGVRVVGADVLNERGEFCRALETVDKGVHA